MSSQLFSIITSIKQLFSKHHPVIFITILTLMLAAAVFSLYQILEITSETPTAAGSLTTFDQATVDKIKKLHDSSDTSDALVFPSPRVNPFSE